MYAALEPQFAPLPRYGRRGHRRGGRNGQVDVRAERQAAHVRVRPRHAGSHRSRSGPSRDGFHGRPEGQPHPRPTGPRAHAPHGPRLGSGTEHLRGRRLCNGGFPCRPCPRRRQIPPTLRSISRPFLPRFTPQVPPWSRQPGWHVLFHHSHPSSPIHHHPSTITHPCTQSRHGHDDWILRDSPDPSISYAQESHPPLTESRPPLLPFAIRWQVQGRKRHAPIRQDASGRVSIHVFRARRSSRPA